MRDRLKFILGSAIVLLGFVYLFTSSVQQASATHMTVSGLMEKLQQEDLQGQRIQLGGQVVARSIQWDTYRHRPTFSVTEGDTQLQVHYVGNGLLPDTFKEGSPVLLEGYYLVEKGHFEANVVFAKCPSKYEGEGHIYTDKLAVRQDI